MGTWIQSVVYYSKYFKEVVTVIDKLPETDSAACVKAVKDCLNDSRVKNDIAYITSNFSFIPASIEQLEREKQSLCSQIAIVKEAQVNIHSDLGETGKKVKNKRNNVLNKNVGFSLLEKVSRVISGESVNVPDIQSADGTEDDCRRMLGRPRKQHGMENSVMIAVEKLLSSSLLSKNLKVGIYKTVILPVVLYGCETWTLTLREEQRLRVFENKILRKIFGAKRDEVTGELRKLHNAELHTLYFSPDIIRNIKSRRLRWGGHVARMGESRNAYRVLFSKMVPFTPQEKVQYSYWLAEFEFPVTVQWRFREKYGHVAPDRHTIVQGHKHFLQNGDFQRHGGGNVSCLVLNLQSGISLAEAATDNCMKEQEAGRRQRARRRALFWLELEIQFLRDDIPQTDLKDGESILPFLPILKYHTELLIETEISTQYAEHKQIKATVTLSPSLPPHATFSPTPTLANQNAKPHCQAEVEVQSISKRLKLLPLYELKRSRKTLLSYETVLVSSRYRHLSLQNCLQLPLSARRLNLVELYIKINNFCPIQSASEVVLQTFRDDGEGHMYQFEIRNPGPEITESKVTSKNSSVVMN
ncbi:hypothetical protein ANN_26077 [Periplaneta americana]|uniref:Uncharacterized protein n=1 Tax=Periplaneta americana TaxID=6978 RepID=A0ABQ8S5D2_PERAM|nr:hypothetical protein ANN_26077 [Periplaneta americana]